MNHSMILLYISDKKIKSLGWKRRKIFNLEIVKIQQKIWFLNNKLKGLHIIGLKVEVLRE